MSGFYCAAEVGILRIRLRAFSSIANSTPAFSSTRAAIASLARCVVLSADSLLRWQRLERSSEETIAFASRDSPATSITAPAGSLLSCIVSSLSGSCSAIIAEIRYSSAFRRCHRLVRKRPWQVPLNRSCTLRRSAKDDRSSTTPCNTGMNAISGTAVRCVSASRYSRIN